MITWSPRYSKFRGFANKPCGCKERRLSREADSHKRAACAWGERSLPFRPAPRGLHMGRFLAGFGPGSVQAPIASGNRKQRYPCPCCREVAFPGTEQGAAEVARIGCAPCRPERIPNFEFQISNFEYRISNFEYTTQSWGKGKLKGLLGHERRRDAPSPSANVRRPCC